MKSNITVKEIKEYVHNTFKVNLGGLKKGERIKSKVGYYDYKTKDYLYVDFNLLGCEEYYKLYKLLNTFSADSFCRPNFVVIEYSWANEDGTRSAKVLKLNEITCQHSYVKNVANKEDKPYGIDLTEDLQAFYMRKVNGYAEFLIKYNNSCSKVISEVTDGVVADHNERIAEAKKYNAQMQQQLSESTKRAQSFLNRQPGSEE